MRKAADISHCWGGWQGYLGGMKGLAFLLPLKSGKGKKGSL
tara:strand:- start:155 stop:277 length:123 start_codon:yes stop_codon:yes gene_type:complete